MKHTFVIEHQYMSPLAYNDNDVSYTFENILNLITFKKVDGGYKGALIESVRRVDDNNYNLRFVNAPIFSDTYNHDDDIHIHLQNDLNSESARRWGVATKTVIDMSKVVIADNEVNHWIEITMDDNDIGIYHISKVEIKSGVFNQLDLILSDGGYNGFTY